MADEAFVRTGFTINADNLQRREPLRSFRVDVTGRVGPTPGAVTIGLGDTGEQVSFGELTTPGLCQLTNLDETNYVEYGIYEPATSTFYPLGEIGPGESYTIKFSRNLLSEYVGTGTSADTNQFRIRATGGACVVDIACYEK